ncbi:hypothetical protein C5167_043786 [Papaver somniferum]|uniref:Uncharacterized protein n=1 Tax=Papaver somniferum TaxID=3469 RepID=A0A4Y7L9N1_PAPSO|nr:hypothetical protein C5167_043786 [Papaver somniferum]
MCSMVEAGEAIQYQAAVTVEISQSEDAQLEDRMGLNFVPCGRGFDSNRWRRDPIIVRTLGCSYSNMVLPAVKISLVGSQRPWAWVAMVTRNLTTSRNFACKLAKEHGNSLGYLIKA